MGHYSCLVITTPADYISAQDVLDKHSSYEVEEPIIEITHDDMIYEALRLANRFVDSIILSEADFMKKYISYRPYSEETSKHMMAFAELPLTLVDILPYKIGDNPELDAKYYRLYREWVYSDADEIGDPDAYYYNAEGDRLDYSNPDSLFDYGSVGGRWDGYLKVKMNSFYKCVNEAPANVIDWDKTLEKHGPYSILTVDGDFEEECGEDSITKDQILSILSKYTDPIVTIADYHI